MSRVAAIQRRIEAIVAQTTPETKLHMPRFQLGDKGSFSDPDERVYGRRFIVAATGQVEWLSEIPQDREGCVVVEGFEIVVLYPPADPSRRLDLVIREDAIRLQYEMLAPDNWLDDAALKSQRRQVGGYSIVAGETDQDGFELHVPVSVIYRPF